MNSHSHCTSLPKHQRFIATNDTQCYTEAGERLQEEHAALLTADIDLAFLLLLNQPERHQSGRNVDEQSAAAAAAHCADHIEWHADGRDGDEQRDRCNSTRCPHGRARLGLETKQLHRRQSEGSFEQRELEEDARADTDSCDGRQGSDDA